MSFLYRDTLGPKLLDLASKTRLYRRFDGSSKSQYNQNIRDGIEPRFHNGFWKTSKTSAGESYNDIMIFWNGNYLKDTLLTKFVEALGMDWDEFSSQSIPSGIDWVGFRLNKGFKWDGTTGWDGTFDPNGGWSEDTPIFQATNGLEKPTRAELLADIDKVFKVGDEISITIFYGGALKRYIEEHSLPWTATGAAIVSGGFDPDKVRATIESNPWYYLANSRHKPYIKDSNQFHLYDGSDTVTNPNDISGKPSGRNVPPAGVDILTPHEDFTDDNGDDINIELGLFAMMDDGSSWEPVLDKDGSVRVFDESITTSRTNGYTSTTITELCPEDGNVDRMLRCDGEVLEYEYTLKFIYKGSTESSKLVLEMYSWYDAYYQDPNDIPIPDGVRSPDRYKEEFTTSTIDTGFKRALVDSMKFVDDVPSSSPSLYVNGGYNIEALRLMKKKDFARLIQTKMDTKVEKKKLSGFNKFVSRFVAIVFVVFNAIGTFFAPVTLGASAMFTSIVTIMSVAVLQMLGMQFTNSDLKMINDSATIAGIAGTIMGMYGIYQAIEMAATKAAEEAAKEAAKEAGKNAAQQQVAANLAQVGWKDIVNAAVDMALDKVASMFSGSGSAFQSITKALDAFNFAFEKYAAHEARDDKRELEGLQDELDKQNDLLEEVNGGMGSPILADTLVSLKVADINTDRITATSQNTGGAYALTATIDSFKDNGMDVPIDVYS